MLAVLLLKLTSPIWLTIIILLLIFSPGNPFFVQERVGRNSKSFRLLKFRTMTQTISPEQCITIKGDNRITSIGKLLRRFKLDELPQLLNIICGSMTFVGPRPEVPEYVARYNSKQKKILDYQPGLTDPASIRYHNEEEILAQYDDPIKAYFEIILPDKIKISLEYQKNRTFGSDLHVIIQTLETVLQKR